MECSPAHIRFLIEDAQDHIGDQAARIAALEAEVERKDAEIAQLQKHVASGVLGTLLDADENDALLDFLRMLRTDPQLRAALEPKP